MRCNPLTISKGHSRYLLRCDGLLKQREDLAREVFESAFREYGLPYADFGAGASQAARLRTERDLATFSGAPSRAFRFTVRSARRFRVDSTAQHSAVLHVDTVRGAPVPSWFQPDEQT